MKSSLRNLFSDFLENEQASGILLILCTICSLLIANSRFGSAYLDFWHMPVNLGIDGITLPHSIEHWVNDGLMAVFFLLIGLEIERELYIGELTNLRHALLPVIAAAGGMLLPALLHLLLNAGTATQAGAGIPMATDIAFALGALALLGSKIPLSLKVFLTALAIIDDLGAIIIIALFYVGEFSLPFLLAALGLFLVLIVLNRFGVTALSVYLGAGLVLWYCMFRSGVHATLAGVLLAFVIPFRKGDGGSPSYRLQHALHKPVAFVIMPLFALANTGIILGAGWTDALTTANSLGIFAGLVIGKPLGIVLFSLLAVKLGLSQLPDGVSWHHLIGTGLLAGIGFTMSIFISLLAFHSPQLVQQSKIAVLFSSLVAGSIGYLLLRMQKPLKGTTS